MKPLYLFFIFTALLSFSESRSSSNTGQSNMPAPQPGPFTEFEKVVRDLRHYTKDTLKTIEFPGEGGEVIVYHPKTDNLLMQVFLYGETGKINYLYLLDKKLNQKLTKITRYRYDRPFTEAGMQIDSTINYISYLPEVKYFDRNKVLLKDTSMVLELRTASEALLKEIISQAELNQ